MKFPSNKKTFRVSFGGGVFVIPMDKIQDAVNDAIKDVAVDMRVSDGFIQYTVDGVTWENVISLDELEGEPGQPGKTPEKGVDYYTEADKAEMVQAVLAKIPNGDEVKY